MTTPRVIKTTDADPCVRTARALLRNAREMGVLVRRRTQSATRGDGLAIRDPQGLLTGLQRAHLAELTPHVLRLLDGAETVSQFATSGALLAFHSSVLGVTVVLAADNARLAGPDFEEWRIGHGLPPYFPVYRARELPALIGVGEAHLRLIHEAKSEFGGEVTF